MISVSTYYTATCDACGMNFSSSQATLEKQEAELKKMKWAINGPHCFCPKCLEVTKKVVAHAQELATVNGKPSA